MTDVSKFERAVRILEVLAWYGIVAEITDDDEVLLRVDQAERVLHKMSTPA
jgi:hypothetical protein